MQAALDAANARLAQLAQQHAPSMQASPPPTNARELIEWGKIKIKPEGAKLLTDEMSAREYFKVLLQHHCLADARRVLSHSLPKRRALWWGVLTAQAALGDAMPPSLGKILPVVTQFVLTPTEDLRRACGEVAKQIPPSTIAGCLATAAYFSAGSVSPPGLPPVAPRPFITGRLIGVVVYLASVSRDPALYKQYLREYLRWGTAIASGEMLWPEPPASVTPPSRLEAYWPTTPHTTHKVHA
jgi:hypothetical protein